MRIIRMYDLFGVEPGMTVVGADDAPIGRVACLSGDRIKLEPAGIGGHGKHNHYIPGGLVVGVEGNTVRLSATGANAVLMDEEEAGRPAD